MIYGECLDLGRRRKCIVIIRVIDGKVFAEMTFYNNMPEDTHLYRWVVNDTLLTIFY